MATKLDSAKVDKIFMNCLFKEGEDTSKHIPAEGMVCTVGFHPERLESHRQEVEEMLLDLPEEFMQDRGGGWSFLNACNNREGIQWTGFQKVVEQLVQLGIALGKVKYCLPREAWKNLPGGVPYFMVLSGDKEV